MILSHFLAVLPWISSETKILVASHLDSENFIIIPQLQQKLPKLGLQIRVDRCVVYPPIIELQSPVTVSDKFMEVQSAKK